MWTPDLRYGNISFEIKYGLSSARNLRASIMQLAYYLVRLPADSSIWLVLVEPSISIERLQGEWEDAGKVLSPSMYHRMSLAVVREGRYNGFPLPPDAEIRDRLDDLIRSESTGHGEVLPRPHFRYLVLQVLLHRWLLHLGPSTTTLIQSATGCSYPTVAKALDWMQDSVMRLSNRQVELRRFPRQEWSELLVVADRVRGTRRYVDHSGQPRTAEVLLKRVENLQRQDIAIGGVPGAKHYFPHLDLVGNPRAQLSLHCPGETVNLAFVETLDPALLQETEASARAQLVVHLARQHESLFIRENGATYAGPVECLMDLHELRLIAQADSFVQYLRAHGPAPW